MPKSKAFSKLFAAACLALSLSSAFMAPAAQARRLADGCYFLWGEGQEPVGYMCCSSGNCHIEWF
jgi:hypothetical protein